MATEPDAATALLTVLQEEERAKRHQLREAQLQVALQKLHKRHHEERQALSQELRELADGRKAIQDQVWADWISSSSPDQQRKLSAELPTADRCLVEQDKAEAASKLKYEEQEDGASPSTAGAALNGKDGLGEGDEENVKKQGPGYGDEEIPNWPEIFLKTSQQRDKEKQEPLKELLMAKSELRVEVQCMLEVLEEKVLRKAYEHRITVENLHVINKAHQRTRQAGLLRFMNKRKLDELERTASKQIAYVDSELGSPELPDCYKEIKKLLDVETNPILSKALQEWNRKEELFCRRLEGKKNRLASLKNEVYQLIGFFSVFQGVVLTTVSQSSLLYCHNMWSPINLSVLASVISTLGAIKKLEQIEDVHTNIASEERDLRTTVQMGQRLRDPGSRGLILPT